MSQRQLYEGSEVIRDDESATLAQLEGEDDEAMDEVLEDDYASSTPTSSSTWISWFCSLPGHEYFCEVAEDFIEDDFNLTGLNSLVPFWKEAMEIVLDVEPEDALRIPDMSIVETSAELLYGLVHQRYILTRPGLQAMVEKYEAGHFGLCPRVYCQSMHVAPCGRSDLPGLDTVKLYCPNCNDIYVPPSSRYQAVDGAFFGTTFAPLLFQTFRELAPAPFCPSPNSPLPSSRSTDDVEDNFLNPNPHGGKRRPHGRIYEPRLFGFKVNEKARSGPRMKWLRLRPEAMAELDLVDWTGQWKADAEGEEEDEYEDDEEEEDERPPENFYDDDLPEDDDDEEEEEEEEDYGAGPTSGGASGAPGSGGSGRVPSLPHPPAAPSGRLGRRALGTDWKSAAAVTEATTVTTEESSLATPDDPVQSPPQDVDHFAKQLSAALVLQGDCAVQSVSNNALVAQSAY